MSHAAGRVRVEPRKPPFPRGTLRLASESVWKKQNQRGYRRDSAENGVSSGYSAAGDGDANMRNEIGGACCQLSVAS